MIINFTDRLDLVLDGRKLHNWGDDIGISKTVLTRMNKGILPGAEKLLPALHADNISITWLIEGSGQPYLVYNSLNDLDASEYLEALLDEDWSGAYIITDNKNNAIVLTQPGSYFLPDGEKEYKYTVVEVIAGIVGTRTLSLLEGHDHIYKQYKKEITSKEMLSLNRGQIGTYQLLFKDGALLADAEEIHPPPQVSLSDDRGLYDSNEKINETIEYLRRLDDETFDQVRAIIRKLTER